MLFQTALSERTGDHEPDLNGYRTDQAHASSPDIPFIARNPEGNDGIVLTGGRLT